MQERLNFFVIPKIRLFNANINWQMFTNGMSESISSEVYLKDVPLEAFKTMLEFMYSGELNKEDTMDIGILLLQLLLLADQFGISGLHQECCKTLLECLSQVEWQSLSRPTVYFI